MSLLINTARSLCIYWKLYTAALILNQIGSFIFKRLQTKNELYTVKMFNSLHVPV